MDKHLLVGSRELGLGEETVRIDDQAVADDQTSTDSWLRFVRDDLTDIDQQILDHTTGIGGAKVLSNKQLARRLQLTPGAISQRKLKIQAILDREEELSPFL